MIELQIGLSAATLITMVAFGMRISRHMGIMENKIDTLWSQFLSELHEKGKTS